MSNTEDAIGNTANDDNPDNEKSWDGDSMTQQPWLTMLVEAIENDQELRSLVYKRTIPLKTSTTMCFAEL